MTKTDQRNTLILRILTALLQYEGDRCCLSDHVHGDLTQLRYYVSRYRGDNASHPYRFFTVKGYMYAELTADDITIDEVTLSDLPGEMVKYHQKKPPLFAFPGHVQSVADLFDTLNTDPVEYRAAPMTHLSCDAPAIDHWIEGHVDMLTAVEDYNRSDPARKKAPNGPAPITIRHTAEMLPVTNGEKT